MNRSVLALSFLIATATAAQAHVGHVAENGAGHTHWLAIGAAVSALVLAAVLIRRRARKLRLAAQ